MMLNFRTEIAPTLPRQPGVYLMKDSTGNVIYVGKAKNLKNRVSSYFSGKKEAKTEFLVRSIHSIETIITSGESEALLLENNLIKKYSPKYNISLKDGKTYPVLKITNETWPRIFKTRQVLSDGARYFGPFTDVRMLDIYIELIRKLYPIRRCKGKLRKREFPCLYYHLKQCSGPCIAAVSKEEYNHYFTEIEELLAGDNEKLKATLQQKMQQASESLEFEKAAWFRDSLTSLETVSRKQDIIDFNPEVRDYISWRLDEDQAVFAVFQMREGRMSGRDLLPVSPVVDEDDAVRQFIIQYYEGYHDPPDRVFLQSTEGMSEVASYLSQHCGHEVLFSVPDNSRDSSILNMGRENCHHELIRRRRKEGEGAAIEELQRVLELPRRPVRIEGFDIAQLHGKHTVASLITFHRGKPDPSGYRSFNIKSLDGKIDDFEAVREAVARRYSRLKNEQAPMPHLILIDGGPGQVSAAAEILHALELEIPVVGLAKKEEEIYRDVGGPPIILAPGSEALMLLQAVRDETHRFATSKSRKQREKGLTFARLESIEGIGPARSRELMQKYGSIKEITQLSAGQIAKETSLSLKQAERLVDFLAQG